MKINLFVLIFVFSLSGVVFAEEEIIAHGENPNGKSYFAYEKLVLNKKDAGWKDANIPNGIFEVVVTDGKLDVRFIDATKSIKSARSQGAEVMTLSKGKNEATIVVMYPAETIEVYTLYVDSEGQQKFIMTVTKSGDNALITQSSIYTGSCSFIHFEKLSEKTFQ